MLNQPREMSRPSIRATLAGAALLSLALLAIGASPAEAGLLSSLPGLLTQITQFDIDRFNAALLTVAPGAPPTARIDFYDRSGAVIQTITFDAS